jgi:phosphatidylserine/phosphatidylglycerophosphate/cardiolipin synthase-like enzyme
MKFLKWVVVCVVLFASLNVKGWAQTVFQIVESVPAETILEESKLPKATDVWIEMIKAATKTIDMETFYIANEKGEPLEKVISEVKSAAARGVVVRIMIDGKFFERYKESANDFENVPNITIKKIPFDKIGGGIMHAKYFVVDGEDLFVGSQNFDWRALKHIHEMGVRVKHKELAEMFLRIFETDWALCDNQDEVTTKALLKESADKVYTSKKKLKLETADYGTVKLYPAFSPVGLVNKGFAKEETELLKTIKKAKNRLCIQFYSYATKGKNKNEPYDKIDKEIRKAAARGVDVKIIFSDWAIKKDAMDAIKELSQVKGIEIRFSTMPQYSKGYIPYARVQHCKYFIADDDVSWISTSNWERDYFYESRNAALIIESEKVNETLEGVFNRVWNSTYVEKVDVDKEYKAVKRN